MGTQLLSKNRLMQIGPLLNLLNHVPASQSARISRKIINERSGQSRPSLRQDGGGGVSPTWWAGREGEKPSRVIFLAGKKSYVVEKRGDLSYAFPTFRRSAAPPPPSAARARAQALSASLYARNAWNVNRLECQLFRLRAPD